MMNMSFYKGTLDKAKAIEIINGSSKPCKYTYGFKYRRPTTHLVSVTKERAAEIINRESLVDIVEYDDYIDINAFSSNDMF